MECTSPARKAGGMRMNKMKIAPYQLFCLFFLGRAFSSMLYSPTLSGGITPVGSIIGMLIGLAVQLLLLVPLFILMKQNEGEELQIILLRNTGKTAYVLLFLYIFYCFLVTVSVLCEVSYFMSNFTREYEMIFYILVALALAVYMAKFGLQTIARVGFILFVVLAAAILTMILAGTSHMNLYNLTPLSQNFGGEIFDGFFRYTSGNMELVLLPILFPFIKTGSKGTKKAAVLTVCVTTFFSAYLMFFSATMLGDYMEHVVHPYFVSLAGLNLFGIRRLDILQIYLWFAVAAVKAALFLFSAVYLTSGILPTQKRKPVFWIFSVAVLGTSLAVGCSLSHFSVLSLVVRNAAALALLIVAVPVILLICNAVRKGKRDAQKI